MSDVSGHKVLARPYAKAAYEFARDKQQIAPWIAFLALAAQVVQNVSVAKLLKDPRFGSKKVAELIIEIAAGSADQYQQNFMELLAENNRLENMPEIYQLFEELRRKQEHSMDVDVITVTPLSSDHQVALTNALQKRFQCQIKLHNKIDKLLIGGAIIRAGDRIIDGSARGKLNRLSNYILLKDRVWQ